MKHLVLVFLASTVAIVPDWAGAFRAVNRQEVNALPGGVFEVIGRSGAGASDYWCGAADYARHVLDTGATQRIYISRAIGPSEVRPGKKAVQFSLTPPPNADVAPGYSLSVKVVGDNLTSAAAMQYCYDRIEYSPGETDSRPTPRDA